MSMWKRSTFLQPHFNAGISSSETTSAQSRFQDNRTRLQGGSWLLLHLRVQDEESYRSLSVGLSHRRDLHLLLLEGLRRQIQDHYSISIFYCISLLPDEEKWNDVFPVRKTTNSFFHKSSSKENNKPLFFKVHSISESTLTVYVTIMHQSGWLGNAPQNSY